MGLAVRPMQVCCAYDALNTNLWQMCSSRTFCHNKTCPDLLRSAQTPLTLWCSFVMDNRHYCSPNGPDAPKVLWYLQPADTHSGNLRAAEGTFGYCSGWQGCTGSTLHGHGTPCPVGSVFSISLSCCATSSLQITPWAHEQLLVGHSVPVDMIRRGKQLQHLESASQLSVLQSRKEVYIGCNRVC